jgi:flavin reductase (DIM6/NTAB) family NADH-FMN oxidoreductase RutF
MSQFTNEVDALASISPANFKTAMRCFASTVNVITSGRGTALNGMTATAVCSVSAEPPSILIVVNQENRSHALIQRSGAYTVNVLSASQESLAAHFASGSVAPFATVPYSLGLNKCPIIDNCTSFLECVVESRIRFGTHSVFIGRVVASGASDSLPLIYHDGKYRY